MNTGRGNADKLEDVFFLLLDRVCVKKYGSVKNYPGAYVAIAQVDKDTEFGTLSLFIYRADGVLIQVQGKRVSCK